MNRGGQYWPRGEPLGRPRYEGRSGCDRPAELGAVIETRWSRRSWGREGRNGHGDHDGRGGVRRERRGRGAPVLRGGTAARSRALADQGPGNRAPNRHGRGRRRNRRSGRHPGTMGDISPGARARALLTPHDRPPAPHVGSARAADEGDGAERTAPNTGPGAEAGTPNLGARGRRKAGCGALGWPGMRAATWCVESRACASSLSVPVPASTPSSIP